jgi:TIR domain
MKTFISYAKQQRHIAEDINAVLSARGHSVFFDRESLAPGLEYQTTIRREVEDCEVFVFLISPESVTDRRYTLTELGYRKRKILKTSGTLLPVVVKPTLLANIPAYLRTVTLQFPQGNLSVDVADAIDRLAAVPTQAPECLELPLHEHKSEVFEVERISAYRRLWELTRILPRWPRASNVPYSELRAFSAALRDWYFIGGGGIFLSRPAHGTYSSVQNTLQAILSKRASGPIAADHYDEVREVCSALRSQLAKDIGARGD